MPIDLPLRTENNDVIFEGDVILVDANDVKRFHIDRETGSVRIRDRDGNLVCHIDFPGANFRLGGHGRDGDLLLYRRSASDMTDAAQASFHFNADTGVLRLGSGGSDGRIVLADKDGNQAVFVDGGAADVAVGGGGQHGRVVAQSGENQFRAGLFAEEARILAGGQGADGDLRLRSAEGETRIVANAETGVIRAGGNGVDGELRLNMADGKTTVRMEADGGEEGPIATLRMGGDGVAGAISILNAEGEVISSFSRATISLGGKEDGKLLVNANNGGGIAIDGHTSQIKAGAFDAGGEIILQQAFQDDESPADIIRLQADTGKITVGGGSGHGIDGRIEVRDKFNNSRVLIDGEAGDITLPNGDVAELFDIAPEAVEHVLPGSVVVLNAEGLLQPCEQVADTRVAGIVASAGDTKPGVVMGTDLAGLNAVPLALVGRVWVQADADAAGAIIPGDLLTTSSRVGHAQKVNCPAAATGAIIGKALGVLHEGLGLVPVLIMMR